MHKLTFYQQTRIDGGVRTGIDADGESLLHHYQEGAEEYDPALLWYIDVRCHGTDLPTTPEEARAFYDKLGPRISAGLRQVAEEIQLGVDGDYLPLTRQIPGVPKKVKVTVAVSAIRRLNARAIAAPLKQLAENWEHLLQSLSPAERV